MAGLHTTMATCVRIQRVHAECVNNAPHKDHKAAACVELTTCPVLYRLLLAK